jgi:beta-lactamase regulating signal transducer with metallopeptidase domain
VEPRVASGGTGSEEDVNIPGEEEEEEEQQTAAEPSRVTSVPPERVDEDSAVVPVAVMEGSASRLASRASSPFSWRAVISLAWLAGCAVFLLRLLLAVVGLVRLRRASSVVSAPAVLEVFEEAKRTAGFKTRVELRVSNRVASPVSVGMLRPVILLPEYLPREVPLEQLRPILLHELAHIRCRDYTINVIQRFAQALFFFHPLAHLLSRHLRNLREEICDYWVMDHCGSATLYARALTTLAERLIVSEKMLMGVGLFGHRLRFAERIKRIVSSGRRLPTTIRLRTAAALLCGFVVLLGALSIASLSARTAKAAAARGEVEKSAELAAKEHVVTWKGDTVYRDGKPYAKIVQWEPEADFPMIAFGDQNNNGKTDIWIRFLNGKPLRIEIDSNEDGRIDKWEHYFNGVIDLVEVDTDFNRRVDLWQVYDNGKLFREEIDENADGSVDKWLEADENGKLVEKEIVSWVVRDWLEARYELPGQPASYRPAEATFFNAADKVEKTEVRPRSESAATSSHRPSPTATPPPRQPQFRYRPITGCRIEYTKEVDGNKVVAGWFHESLEREEPRAYAYWGDTPARPGQNQPVRYLAVDIGFDGGVDAWGQVGAPVTETPPPESGRRRQSLFSALWDDTNRDGRADHAYVTLGQDANSRQVRSQVYETDSDGDGLVDGLGWEPGRSFRIDADHDGVFESFDSQWRLGAVVEANGTSSLRMELKGTAGPQPAPLLCMLTIPGVREGIPYRRGFWLAAGEPAVIPKLSRGVYDLSVSIGGSDNPNDYRVTTFSYPGFLLVEKGQSVSKTITWDSRPVFRGRLISADAKPLAGAWLKVLTSAGAFASVSLHTDSAGDFELFNIPPGPCTLSVEYPKPGFHKAIEVVRTGEREPERQLFLTSLPSRDWKIPTGWEAPLALSGKVFSHDGQPLANMLVEASSLAEERISRRAVSGPDGSYRIFALVPGPYSVAIYNNDFPKHGTPLQEFQLRIEVTPMQKDFQLSAPLPVILE